MLATASARSSQDIEEQLLIHRVAKRERQAFEQLYRRYAPRLGRYLNRYLRQREWVEEAINDVMLVLWQNADRFDPEAARLSTWIFGIAHNKARKAFAQASRHPTEDLFPDELTDAGLPGDVEPSYEPAPCANPEQVVLSEDSSRALRHALEKLPPEQRAVVELTYRDFLIRRSP